MLIRGGLANALDFTGSSYLFHRQSADNIDAKRKRHDVAIEKLQKAQIEWAHKWQQRIHFINIQLRLERKAETKFTDHHNQSSDILQHSQNRPTGDRWLKF